MPELTHDAEDGFHEIQLSGKQLVFLFMATTLVSVVIFLCGVLVGRGVRAERGGDDPSAIASAMPAAPAEAVPAPGAPPPPVPSTEGELTYDKTLRDKNAPNDTLKNVKPAAPPPAADPPPSTPPANTTPAPQAQQPAPAATPQKPVAPPPARADVPTSGKAGAWVIQVHALQNREAATTFVKTLAAKGYPAFLLNPAAGSPQIYRVQIGGYRERAEAEQIARRLEKEEQFKPAIKRR